MPKQNFRESHRHDVGFEVLRPVVMKSTIFWDIPADGTSHRDELGFIVASKKLPEFLDEIQASTEPMKWPQKSYHGPET
jgi:hypothetical protein